MPPFFSAVVLLFQVNRLVGQQHSHVSEKCVRSLGSEKVLIVKTEQH